MRHIVNWVVLGVLSATAVATSAASFDCAKAQTKVDTLICRSPEVSKLDESLDLAYRDILAKVLIDERQALIDDQRKWLRISRNACGDEPCLIDVYRSRIDALKQSTSPSHAEPLTKVEILGKTSVPIGKGYPEIISQLNGNLLYRHYDDTGNTKDIVELNFLTGDSRALVQGRRDPRLIAINSRYIVLHVPGNPPSFPIEVIERSTDNIAKRLRLGEPILAAFIEGQQLVALQSTTGYGEGSALSFTLFELPSLKVLRVKSIPGIRLISMEHGLVVQGYQKGRPQLIFYDRQLQERGRLDLPPPQAQLTYSCGLGPLRLEGDVAALVANCGEIHVINMKTFSIERTIPRYANFYSVVLRNGLIYTASENRDGIVVFDAASGRELGRIPIRGGSLYASKNMLLVAGRYERYEEIKWPMSVYEIHDQALRSGSWRMQSILQACSEARRKFGASGDIYEAAELCGRSGIDSMLRDEKNVSDELRGLAIDYAIWLTKTLDRYDDGRELLEKLGEGKTHAIEIYEANLKKSLFKERVERFPEALQERGDFSRALARGLKRPPPMRFDLPDGQLYFFDDFVYMPRESCGDEKDGVYVNIYDRKTFKSLRSVKILGCSDDHEDSIRSVSADKDKLYVRTEQYEGKATSHHYFVFRKSDWAQVVAKAYSPDTDAFPLIQGVNDRDSQGYGAPKETRSLVMKQDYRPPRFIYSFYRRESGNDASPVATFVIDSDGASTPDLISVPGSDSIIFRGKVDDRKRFPLGYFDPLSKSSKTFASLSELGAWAADKTSIYLSSGSEVLVFDPDTFVLREVLPHTLRGTLGSQDEAITGLYIHGKDLIVRTKSSASYLFPLAAGR